MAIARSPSISGRYFGFLLFSTERDWVTVIIKPSYIAPSIAVQVARWAKREPE